MMVLHFLKRDYINVRDALRTLYGEIPNWICFIYYVLMLPIGLVLSIFVMLYWAFTSIKNKFTEKEA